MQTHPIIPILFVFLLACLGQTKTVIGTRDVCQDSSGCTCKSFVSYDKYSEFGEPTEYGNYYAYSHRCQKGETCLQFDSGQSIHAYCEALLKDSEVCLSGICKCFTLGFGGKLSSQNILCSKGETCHGTSAGHFCLMYIAPGQVCTARDKCLCKKDKLTLKLARTQKCVLNRGQLEAEKSKILPMGVVCTDEAGCQCDSRQYQDGTCGQGTCIKVKKGLTCFLTADKYLPVAYTAIRSGTLTSSKDLMCISNKFDPRNPRTYDLCGNFELCLDHKDRAYCATVSTTSLKSFSSYRKKTPYGYMVAVLKPSYLRDDKPVDDKPWKQKTQAPVTNVDDYFTQFCFPHEEVEDAVLGVQCKASEAVPEIADGQICNNLRGQCTCGSFKNKRNCYLGEKCVEGDGESRPTCEPPVARIECLSGYNCPCRSVQPSLDDRKKNPGLNKWSPQTPVCDTTGEVPEFTSTEKPYTTIDDVEEAYLKQIDNETVSIAAPFRRLSVSRQSITQEIKI